MVVSPSSISFTSSPARSANARLSLVSISHNACPFVSGLAVLLYV